MYHLRKFFTGIIRGQQQPCQSIRKRRRKRRIRYNYQANWNERKEHSTFFSADDTCLYIESDDSSSTSKLSDDSEETDGRLYTGLLKSDKEKGESEDFEDNSLSPQQFFENFQEEERSDENKIDLLNHFTDEQIGKDYLVKISKTNLLRRRPKRRHNRIYPITRSRPLPTELNKRVKGKRNKYKNSAKEDRRTNTRIYKTSDKEDPLKWIDFYTQDQNNIVFNDGSLIILVIFCWAVFGYASCYAFRN